MAYATKLTTIVVGCGKGFAGKNNRGFTCVPAWDQPKESVLGSAGSFKDCRIITKTLTKALKKVSRKPVIKFVCEAYGGSFHRVTLKPARMCEESVASVNTLVQLLAAGDFANCAVRTTTTAKPGPTPNLGCLVHHKRQEGSSVSVLQSSEATCPSQVAELDTLLKACGLKDRFAGGITCSAAQDGSSMLTASADDDTARMTARYLTRVLQARDPSLPPVSIVEGVYSNRAASKCSLVASSFNVIIEAGAGAFTC